MKATTEQLSSKRSRLFAGNLLDLTGDAIRLFVRASAISGFAFGLVLFLLNPPPWCSSWDPWKFGTVDAIGLAVLISCLSLAVSPLAVVLTLNGRAHRPMRWYLVLDGITVILGLLTPAL